MKNLLQIGAIGFLALICLFGCSSTVSSISGGGSSDALSRTGDEPSAGASDVVPETSGNSSREASEPTFQNRSDAPVTTVTLGGRPYSLYSHPRIWLTPDLLPGLQSRAVPTNAMWVDLKDSVDRKIQDGSYQTTADASTLLNYSIAYLATGSAEYLSAAKTILLNFLNPALYDISCDGSTYCGNDNLDYGSIELMYLSASFDWLQGSLSASEKQSFRDWVYGQFIPFLRMHPYYGDPLHNLGHTKWCGEFLWALATLGDDPRAGALADDTFVFWSGRVLPVLDDVFPGGHTYSGSGYGYNRVFKFQLYAFEAAWSALGANMYGEHPWPVDEVFYRIHSMLPIEGTFHSDWESAEASFNQGRMNENEAILAMRYRGSYGGKLAQDWLVNDFRPRAFYNQGGTRVNPIYAGLWFLWYDPSAEQLDYSSSEPTAYVSDGLGAFFSRSAWRDVSSTWVTLSAAKYIGDHQLHNEGSFKIFKHEYLVVENGRFYAGQASNLTPVDTNILFIGDGAVAYGNVTGGLYRRNQGSLAHIDRFKASENEKLSYARADLTTAYVPAYFPLDFFHRSLVHLKPLGGSPFDYVVLFDRIRSGQSETKKTFVHLVEPPSIAGDVATMTSTQGLARLFVSNLLPESTALETETVTDKTAGGFSQEASDHPTRLVFRKIAAGQEDQFLATFAITDQMSAPAPAVVRVESSDAAWIGALISDPAHNRVVLFSKTEAASSNPIQYSVSKSAPTQHAILDLPPDSAYDVSVSGTASERTITVSPNTSGLFTADGQGVLFFSDE